MPQESSSGVCVPGHALQIGRAGLCHLICVLGSSIALAILPGI